MFHLGLSKAIVLLVLARYAAADDGAGHDRVEAEAIAQERLAGRNQGRRWQRHQRRGALGGGASAEAQRRHQRRGTREPDYIIIGAGTAGSLLAERLSRHSSVLVIEQGKGFPTETCAKLPGACCTYSRLSRRQRRCTYRQFRRMYGRYHGYHETGNLAYRTGVGGTSAIAIGVHFRGRPSYWKELAAAHGKHWLLPEARLAALEREMHVNKAPFVDKDHVKFAQVAARTFSHNLSSPRTVVAGINAKGAFNFPRYQDRHGYATNAYTQFLKKALRRPRVHLMSGATVNKLIPRRGAAPVVRVRHGRWTRRIRAKKEVILAGGALGSAALLRRSGVNTAALLDQADIRMGWSCPGCRYKREFLRHLPALLRGHLHDRNKVLTLPVYDSGVFVELEGSPVLILAATEVSGRFDLPRSVRYKTGIDDTTLVVHIVLLQPHNFKGEVNDYGELRDSKRLTDPRDIAAATAAMQAVRKAVKAFSASVVLGNELFPGARVKTDGQMKRALRSRGNVFSFQSATGTCRVGKVVDGSLRVKGVHGLRVADASVLPKPPLGRTLFSTLMVAEIASDLITKGG